MKIILFIIGFFLCIAILLLLAKVYIRGTILYTNVKKEMKIAVHILFKIVKVTVVIDFVTANGEVDISVLGFHYKKDIKSYFHKQEIEKIKKEVPKTNDKKEEKKQEEKVKKEKDYVSKGIFFIKMAKQLHTICTDFLHTVALERLKINVTYGIENAATTGMSLGVLWSGYGLVLGILKSYLKVVCTPQVEVHPFYQGSLFQMDGTCVFSFRPIYIFIYGFKVFKVIKQERNVEENPVSSTSV